MGLVKDEVKCKSKKMDLTGEEEENKNEGPDVLGLPFCLDHVKWTVSDVASGLLWSAAGVSEVPEGYKEILQKVVNLSGWGENVLGEKNLELSEA